MPLGSQPRLLCASCQAAWPSKAKSISSLSVSSKPHLSQTSFSIWTPIILVPSPSTVFSTVYPHGREGQGEAETPVHSKNSLFNTFTSQSTLSLLAKERASYFLYFFTKRPILFSASSISVRDVA